MTTAIDRRTLIAASFAALAATHARSVKPTRLGIDGLSFLPEDLSQIAASGIGAMICDVSEVEEVRDPDGTPRYRRTYARCATALDVAVARLAGRSDVFVARRGDEIGSRPGCAAFLQFQSSEPIGVDLSRLGYFHDRGLRVLQFTHHNNTLFAGGCLERAQSGLTPLGIAGLAEMNRLAILPDVSHGSDATILQAARLSKTPIAYSHGACRAIVDHPRCISDANIRAIASGGGIVGIFMMSFWLTTAPVPTPDDWVRHIRHVLRTGGLASVGIANDFPMAGQPNLVKLGNDNARGVGEYLEWWHAMRALGLPGFADDPKHVVIPAFNRIERMSVLEATLERARFKSREIDAIMGENWRRVLSAIT